MLRTAHAQSAAAPVALLQKGMLAGVLLNVALIGYGLIRVPTTLTASGAGIRSVSGALGILLIYGLVGRFAIPRSYRAGRQALWLGVGFGLAIGTVFLCQMLVEYFAPLGSDDDGTLAVVTFGAMFLFFVVAAGLGGLRAGSVRSGVSAAIWSALVGSLIWFNLLLVIHYVFMGTALQDHVLLIDQTDADYRRSGMADLRAFVMQDYLGGGFFHLLLGPAIAAVLGALGGAAGKGMARLRRHGSGRA